MDTVTPILLDAFERIRGAAHQAVDGLDPEQLSFRVDPEANTVAWLVWHLARVQDDHVSELAGTPQRWHAGGWADRFALPFDRDATGYGQSAGEVGAVRVSAELLTGYLDDVHRATTDYLPTLGEADLERIVDTSWDPPVTLRVRLVSVIADDLEHAGQAAFVRGVLLRRTG